MLSPFNSGLRSILIKRSVLLFFLLLFFITTEPKIDPKISAQPNSSQSIKLYMDSRMLDKGSGGFVRIAFGQITLDQLTSISIIDHQNNVSILPSTQQSTKIMVYVPKGLSKARTKEFLQLIKKEIDKKYPRAKFKIVPSYIEVKKHEEALDLQALIIRDMLRHPSNNLDASLLRNLLNTNLQLKSKLQQWKNSFAQKIKEIKRLNYDNPC